MTHRHDENRELVFADEDGEEEQSRCESCDMKEL